VANPITIKKYPNRSLYDTSQSKYISISDLRQYVLDDVAFEVQDAKSKNDITRQVLLQIITEAENEGTPMFSTDVLTRFIKMYGDSMTGALNGFIDQMSSMIDQQTKQFLEQITESRKYNPVNVWSDVVNRNLEIWQETQQKLLKASGVNRDKKRSGGGSD
jgi:polyhydroxyalkanoate synthesis repressor PhaR